MKKLLVGILLLATLTWCVSAVQAQDRSSNWLGNTDVGGNNWYLNPNQFTTYRDYIGSGSSFFWTRQPRDVAINPDQEPDNRLEIQVLQKPRIILWVQPVQQVGGFKLFLQF